MLFTKNGIFSPFRKQKSKIDETSLLKKQINVIQYFKLSTPHYKYKSGNKMKRNRLNISKLYIV